MSRDDRPCPPLTFTLDLENHRHGSTRYIENTERLLDFFAQHSIHATVFVVGELATTAPDLLRRIHACGHELALHSYRHTPLTDEQPASFSAALARARDALEDICGTAVTGFRAPSFSLTPTSRWVVDVLVDLGFSYSSSVLPGSHPLFGYPGAPRQPFRWPNGLLELPVPLVAYAGLALPFLGGIYLRYLPPALVSRWRRQQNDALPWSYIHPYDIDAEESYYRFSGTSWWMSALLWRKRSGTLARLAALHAASGGISAPPLAERVARGDGAAAPIFRS